MGRNFTRADNSGKTKNMCLATDLHLHIYIYTLNRHKFDYYSTGLTPGGNARKDESGGGVRVLRLTNS